MKTVYEILRLSGKPFIVYRVSLRPFIRFCVYHVSYHIVRVCYPIVRLSYPIVRVYISYPIVYHVKVNVTGTVVLDKHVCENNEPGYLLIYM